VEVPPTQEHWESAFVAPYVSLARGWERQLDIADNPIFYHQGALTAESYQEWLYDGGITYVALPDAPLDYAAQAEKTLLTTGNLPYLRLVWSTPNWQLWQVLGSPGLVSGPATLTTLEPDHLTLVASAPGQITVRVRYTKYWSVASGQACVSQGAADWRPSPNAGVATYWTSVQALSAGVIQLSASVIHPDALPACALATRPPG
jgi:hypothetical protein